MKKDNDKHMFKKIQSPFKIFIKDILVIFALLALYNILNVMKISADVQFTSLIVITFIEMFFYGIPIYICYALSIRMLNSSILFFAFSWLLTFLPILLSIIGASGGNLTYYQGGVPIYINGEITFMGVLYKWITPLFFMALYATYRWLKPKFIYSFIHISRR